MNFHSGDLVYDNKLKLSGIVLKHIQSAWGAHCYLISYPSRYKDYQWDKHLTLLQRK
jgi:hypothetical protein